jgi:hypothetical protein
VPENGVPIKVVQHHLRVDVRIDHAAEAGEERVIGINLSSVVEPKRSIVRIFLPWYVAVTS